MIYVKTEVGQAALHDRSIALTPRQRSAFIMFDGKRSMADVVKATAGLGVTAEDIHHLMALGLLVPVAETAAPEPEVPVSSHNVDGSPTLSAQEHYSMAYPIATRLTAALGLRGFRLNLAVEAANDIDKLKELALKIREAVGPEKFKELESALYFLANLPGLGPRGFANSRAGAAIELGRARGACPPPGGGALREGGRHTAGNLPSEPARRQLRERKIVHGHSPGHSPLDH